MQKTNGFWTEIDFYLSLVDAIEILGYFPILGLNFASLASFHPTSPKLGE